MVVWEEKDTKWKWKSLSLWAVALGLLLSPGSSFVRGSSAGNHIADAKHMCFFSYQNIKVIVLLIDWY